MVLAGTGLFKIESDISSVPCCYARVSERRVSEPESGYTNFMSLYKSGVWLSITFLVIERETFTFGVDTQNKMKLPSVRLGIAGPATISNLIKFGAMSGVGNSLNFLSK